MPFRKILPLLALIIMCGCASIPTPETPADATATHPVVIAPNINLVLPPVDDLGRSVEATQLVMATYGTQQFAFEAHISAMPGHFRMVGLDLVGRKIMTIDWTTSGVTYDKASWVPPQLKVDNILADIVLLYWPEKSVQQALANTEAHVMVSEKNRTITIGDKEIWRANYRPKIKGDLWSGALDYGNLVWGYTFQVQSVEGHS